MLYKQGVTVPHNCWMSLVRFGSLEEILPLGLTEVIPFKEFLDHKAKFSIPLTYLADSTGGTSIDQKEV